jgi:Cation transporter/ATPase, N-terminus
VRARTADTPGSGLDPEGRELTWHTLSAERVLQAENVDGQHGLSSAEAAARGQRFGPNELAEGKAEPRWHAFVRQYRDPMQLVLLATGIGSIYLWVPRTSSTSRDQAIFVDQATDASVPPDAVLLKIDWFG